MAHLNRDELPRCRQCPGNHFEMAFIQKPNFSATRFMAICHALHIVLEPSFEGHTNSESLFINRGNVNSVILNPVEYCPFLEQLRKEGKIPWPDYSINFLNKKS